MGKVNVKMTIKTKRPVNEERVESLKEYTEIMSNEVGMIVDKTEVTDG